MNKYIMILRKLTKFVFLIAPIIETKFEEFSFPMNRTNKKVKLFFNSIEQVFTIILNQHNTISS